MEPVPLECRLDVAELREQHARYRRVAEAVRGVRQDPTELVAELGPEVDETVLAELIAVERECCPFFAIGWDRPAGRLSFAVDPAYERALDAIASALRPGG